MYVIAQAITIRRIYSSIGRFYYVFKYCLIFQLVESFTSFFIAKNLKKGDW